MLPAGMTVTDAAQGFKNWGQFVAAVHVSNNLGLPFDQLKSLMTGSPIPVSGTPSAMVAPVPVTGPMSLGQAIQTLKGTVVPPPTTIEPRPAPLVTTRPSAPEVTTRPAAATAPTARTSSPLTSTQIRAEVKKAEDAARADLRRTRETS
jgi:hypothetical protein